MNTKNNICIICRELKSEFNPEHVIPAAIGGAYTILTVCSECNEKLGKKIDSPFVKHPIILLFRNQFGISRRGSGGNIPNPFKKEVQIDEDGNEYYSQFNDKGELEATMRPKYEDVTQNENGQRVGRMVIPLKNFKSKEEAIALYCKNLKESGLKPSDIERVEIQHNPPKKIEANISAPNNPLIFGVLKIAYEFAITYYPQYINDPQSKIFSNILLAGDAKEEEKKYFDFAPELVQGFGRQLIMIGGIQQYHQVVIFKTIPGKGFYSLIKIFNGLHAICLSKNENYLNPMEGIIIINDSIEQKYFIGDIKYQ